MKSGKSTSGLLQASVFSATSSGTVPHDEKNAHQVAGLLHLNK